jgi:hypothetical protein
MVRAGGREAGVAMAERDMSLAAPPRDRKRFPLDLLKSA